VATTARDVMTTHFRTLRPEVTIHEAVAAFEAASAEAGVPVFGMVVVDEDDHLVGMLSMYDILLLLRPKHVHLWGELTEIDTEGLVAETLRRTRKVQVGDIMTTDLFTVTPETHIFKVLDLMISRHIRRVPVVEEGRMLGLVLLSRVFRVLSGRLVDLDDDEPGP
jgi:CBS domain-containing protein